MLPILQIGPLALPLPQFSILLAFWFGLSLTEKFGPRRGVSAEKLYNLTFIGLITGLIAARLGYVLQYPGAFIQAPLSIISINSGMFDLFSGLGATLIGMLIYGQRARLHFWNTLDALTPLIAVLAIGLALAHIASGEAFGSETGLPWGIELWGAKRHPTQFYELSASFGILIFLGWKAKSNLSAGTLFLGFIGLQAGSRLFLEAFHGDSNLVWAGLRAEQIIAWVTLAAVFIGLEWLRANPQDGQKETQNG